MCEQAKTNLVLETKEEGEQWSAWEAGGVPLAFVSLHPTEDRFADHRTYIVPKKAHLEDYLRIARTAFSLNAEDNVRLFALQTETAQELTTEEFKNW